MTQTLPTIIEPNSIQKKANYSVLNKKLFSLKSFMIYLILHLFHLPAPNISHLSQMKQQINIIDIASGINIEYYKQKFELQSAAVIYKIYFTCKTTAETLILIFILIVLFIFVFFIHIFVKIQPCI